MAAITASMVAQLRAKTDAPMMECKKALTEAEGNMDKAEELLRVKLGNKAGKAASRVTAEGVVVASLGGHTGALLEVNCETDFVSKNELFLSFCNQVANLIAQHNPADVAAVGALPLSLEGFGPTVEDVRKGLIGKIGENIALRRFKRYAGGGQLAAYLHGVRIGVVVEFEGDATAAKDAAMHIAAMKPVALTAAEVPAELIEKERAVAAGKAEEDRKVAEAAGLEREQAQGVAQRAGLGRGLGVPVAAVGAQPAGQIDAQLRAGQVLQALDAGVGRSAAHGLIQPDAKQGVDGQIGGIRRLLGPAQTGLLCQRQRAAGVVGQAAGIAQTRHANLAPQRLQTLLPSQRGQQAVAAVVAAAANHPDPARVRRQRRAQAKHGCASALHQGVSRQLLPGQFLLGQLFDGTAGVAAVQRQRSGQIGKWQAVGQALRGWLEVHGRAIAGRSC